MDDVRRELDQLRQRVTDLETRLARLEGTAPIDPLPPDRDPLRHPQPPPPGDVPPGDVPSPTRL
ncbi:hypothetical protein [Nocardioides currus]|uniref:Uncharacterized protein n=1 Tax=Nocardioides currus TaxID=2133958 RepID=A0A2R7YTZ7_9ACTN|nr:hypothetical protein [Nocardioides currus]PUA79349.1 hypothetical protein C7S10_20290 [Nocardioides currus]